MSHLRSFMTVYGISKTKITPHGAPQKRILAFVEKTRIENPRGIYLPSRACMHAFAFARRTTKHSGITRVQARDVKSCDTLSRHGRERYNAVADRTLLLSNVHR